MHDTCPSSGAVRRMLRLIVLVAAIGFGLDSFVLSPLYIRFVADISYQASWWVTALYYLTDGGLIDLTVFAVCYPATIYAVWYAGVKRAARIPVAYSLITLAKFLVNFFMTCITDRAMPDVEEFFTIDLPMIAAVFFLELLQYILVLAVSTAARAVYEHKCSLAQPDANLEDIRSRVFLFTRLVTFKNPVQLVAFVSAALLFVGRVIMHQVYQYALYKNSGYTDGLVVMILDFLGDLAIALIFYFVSLLLLMRFEKKNKAD